MTDTKGQPLVSIVIVNWNGLEDTLECLQHTFNQTYKNIEIIVVENGSTDGSVEKLRNTKGITLVENPRNLGFTGGHIAGYNAANGEFILLLNNDAIMDKNYIKLAIGYMLSNPGTGAIGGRAYLWDDENPLFDATNKFYAYQNINLTNAEGTFPQSDHGVTQQVNVVSGSCVMVRKSTVDKIGYLHDPFFAYYEESDLFARMKRAGYSIVYNPELAIWHANAKTSNRKGSTYSYYMMMRNRYRFAVRNFDAWSLRRFLKFYIRLGVITTIRSVLPDNDMRPINRAYSKAFFYNLAHGMKPFIERRSLSKQLGKSNYNELIFNEQNFVSYIAKCDSMTELDNWFSFASQLMIGNEMLVICADPKLISHAKKLENKLLQFRLIKNLKFFDTHPENLGAVCAKNEMLVFLKPEVASGDSIDLTSATVYDLYQKNKFAAAFSLNRIENPRSLFDASLASLVIVKRSLLIELGGLLKEVTYDDCLRLIVIYAAIAKSLLLKETKPHRLLNSHIAQNQRGDMFSMLVAKNHEASLQKDRPDVFNDSSGRFLLFRLAQIRILFKWYLSGKITTYLKLARTKNIMIAIITLRRRRLAVEFMHIKNELVGSEYRVDLKGLKEDELLRLEDLKSKPQETTIFIMTRDRFNHLSQLLTWLEKGGFKRIVFVDNDSIFPPLLDYFDQTKYQLLELGQNVGHRCIWTRGIVKLLLPSDFYVLTDPDIVPDFSPKNGLSFFYEVLRKYPDHLKVGAGLRIDDLPDCYALKSDVIKWETQFWSMPLDDHLYEAGVDTTFALYRPHTYEHFIHPSIRTGEPYLSKHLPWYANSKKLSDEDIFYRLRADQNVNTWDKEHLPERYKKELAKKR